MNAKKLFLLFPLLSALTLTSCGKKEEEKEDHSDDISYQMNEVYGEDEQETALGKPVNVTAFTNDPTDYVNRSGEIKNTDMIRVFYRKVDFEKNYSNYVGWRVWAWDVNGGNGAWYEFTKYNDYGVICDIPVNKVAANGTSITTLGIVLTNCNSKTDSWNDATNSYSKDPDSDLIATINGTNINGVQTIYCKGKSKQVYYDQNSVFMSSLDYCYYKSEHVVRSVFVTSKNDFLPHRGRFEININGTKVNDFILENVTSTGKGVDLKFTRSVLPTDQVQVKYKVSENNIISKNSVISSYYYDSDAFKNAFNYTGNDLGVTFDNVDNPTKTTFTVWSPVSSSIELRIYNSSDYRTVLDPIETHQMVKGEKGTFGITLDGNYEGKYYTFVVTNYLGTNEVCDPNAHACGLNGKRGLVCNFKSLNQTISGWAEDTHPNFGSANVDASISEIHVRDMTINPNSGVSEAKRGRFLGLAQSGTTYTEGGTTVKTGLDHLEELGVSHVQIQPMYDYASVDETTLDNTYGKDNYNWGYDPLNYSCLEGSYSSDPVDGYVRIREAKEMIMALHNKGISINMDVVYNHTSGFINSNFQLLVPNYYYRTDYAGVASNGSGCGNEVATERFMVNKFIRESTKFWVEEYHIDGFRFDLMGLMDNQVMIDIYKDCSRIYDKVMVYGEPWTGGTSMLGGGDDPAKLNAQQTVQSSLAQSYFAGDEVLVGAFNDVIRNAIRGDNNPGRGYVNGSPSSATSIVPGIKGQFNAFQSTISPNQVINYVSCHDNYTLNDQLAQTITGDFKNAYKEAEAIIFLSEGVPFIQEGEEFMRSKVRDGKFDHNSYVSGDIVNSMDYSLKVKNIDMFNYFVELINYRNENPMYRMSTREEINENLTNVKASSGSISYELKNGQDNYLIYHQAQFLPVNLDGNYTVHFSTSGRTIGEQVSGTITLNANETIVLKKA